MAKATSTVDIDALLASLETRSSAQCRVTYALGQLEPEVSKKVADRLAVKYDRLWAIPHDNAVALFHTLGLTDVTRSSVESWRAKLRG